MYGAEGKTYSFHPIGSNLANGQVLDSKLFTEMAANARVWRQFEIKKEGFVHAVHA